MARFLEDDEDSSVCIYLENDDRAGVRELLGQVPRDDAKDEEVHDEHDLLEQAERKTKRRNGHDP